MIFSLALPRRWCMPGAVALLILLSGCATQTNALLRDTPGALPRSVELSRVPFFPQERYQCGPATLAMALQNAGFAIAPDALVEEVYVPKLEGSLQVEMLSAGRRNGALTVPIPQNLQSLLTEVASGNPVVVLQNLGLSWIPRWHYAVVVGYDLDQAEIILRSGTTKRLVMSLSTFEHTWERSNYWGMVVLAPGHLPKTAQEVPTVTALIAFEKGNSAALARKSYVAALERWPNNFLLLMGLGNAAAAEGDDWAAADAFQSAAKVDPDSAPAFNNLAVVLGKLGRYGEARRAAEKAVSLGGVWRDAALDTLQSIETADDKKPETAWPPRVPCCRNSPK
jgi:tetratricopeptide (TPR) repeat protein